MSCCLSNICQTVLEEKTNPWVYQGEDIVLKGVLEAKATRSCSKTPVRTGEHFYHCLQILEGLSWETGLGYFLPQSYVEVSEREISTLLKNVLLGV